jgi:hypothetical protein
MGAPADPLILSQRSRIVGFAVEHRNLKAAKALGLTIPQ